MRRFQRFGIDDSGNRISGIMKTVDKFKDKNHDKTSKKSDC